MNPLRDAVAAVPITRDLVWARGPDTVSFLQGQLSQNVTGLPVGGSAWSLLLEPSGKVTAWLRVTRTGDEEVMLDVDAGFGAAVVTRLERFRLRTRCELETTETDGLAVRGPDSDGADAGAADGRLPIVWPGVEGYDLLGPAALDLPRSDAAALEALRIEAGVPRMGAELTEHTIPAEAGQWLIDASVDFTKGCYTGQELVARIDSRGGHVPRPLRGVVVQDPLIPPSGAIMHHDGKAVGELTSVAVSATLGSPVALATVIRALEPPSPVTIAWDGGQASALVESLPLVR
jgi:folate-binding protein YgfZ